MGFTEDFVAGGFAGVAQITVGMPFDTVKVRMQAQQQQLARGEITAAQQLKPLAMARIVVEQSGPRGLFAGMATPLAGIAAVNMVLFSVNNFCLNVMGFPAEHAANATLPALIAAGAISGGTSAGIMGPTELIKTRLQVPGTSKTTSPIAVIKDILAQRGVRGLTRGVGPTVLREGVGNAGFFTGFAVAKQKMATKLDVPVSEIPTYLIPFCGMAGGLSFWSVAYPIDVIKTRQQLETSSSQSSLAAARHLLQNEGIRGFYKGITPALIRCVPVSASIFTTFTIVERFLKRTDTNA
jgi:solute carrier family 25 (mitochondrial carnitine/acylcarnitine transporter), member 20/29